MTYLVTAPAPRIMSLRDPLHKMSKSHNDPRSRILITDSEEEIYRKVNGSLTDSVGDISYDPVNRPGVANLIQILGYFDGNGEDLSVFASKLEGVSLKDVKQTLARRLNGALEPIRDRFRELMESKAGTNLLESVAEGGREAALKNATQTVDKVYRTMGLR